MKRGIRRIRSKAAITLLLLLFSACGEDDTLPVGSDIDCSGENLYGPQGGAIEITDTNSKLYGLRIVVPAGALDECRSFLAQEWYVSPLPRGCMAYPRYDTQFDLGTGGDKPYDVELEFYFPVSGMSIATGEAPCAFGYDERTEKWNIVVPESYDGTTMMVKSTYLDQWSWGKIDIDAISTEDLIGGMKRKYGEEVWNSALGGILEAIDVLNTLYVDKSCATWTRMRDVDLPNLIKIQENKLTSYQPQISKCGTCNLFSQDFGLDLSKYILAKIVILAVDLWDAFTGDIAGYLPFLSSVDFLMGMERYIAVAFIEGLECDYPCVTKELGYDVYATYALHHVYMITQYIVAWAIDGDFWVSCP